MSQVKGKSQNDGRCRYLSCSSEGEVFPTEVGDDSRRQSVAQNIDHSPKPVAAETEWTRRR